MVKNVVLSENSCRLGRVNRSISQPQILQQCPARNIHIGIAEIPFSQVDPQDAGVPQDGMTFKRELPLQPKAQVPVQHLKMDDFGATAR